MDHSTFVNLRREQRTKVIEAHAIEVAERNFAGEVYLLYQLDSFYIEVKYISEDIIMVIRSFSGTLQLNPYLENIDIKWLLE